MEKFKLFNESVDAELSHIETTILNNDVASILAGGVIKMYSGGLPANPNDPIDEKFLIGSVVHPGRVE